MWVLAGAIASCATHPAEQARRDASGPRGVLPDVNPARAYLPLADITPAVSKPEPSEPVSPLSEQAVRRLTLARRLADEQRYTEALFEIERALRYDPNHPDLVRALAVLNWEAGNVQRAMIDARRAIESRPDDIRIHYILGRCEANAGSAGSAIAAYRTALLCSNVESQEELAALCRYHLAKALEQQGYLEAALGQYVEFEESATRIDESSASGELASLLQAKGGSAGQEKSIILERLGRFSEAAQALAKPAADSPDDAVLGLRHATLLMRAERLADALHAVRAIRTSDEAVLRLLAEVHERLGHPMGVIDDLRARAVRRPDDVNLVLALSEALMRFSRPQEAAQELREYLTRHPESVEVRTQLVEVLFTSSAWRDALLLCADAVREHPQDLAGYEMKITALAASEDAVTALLSHPAESGESHISCYFRGVLAAAAGRLEQAEQLLRASLARRATFLPARAALAGVYLRLHRYDDALSAAGREKDDLAEDARLERVLGQVYERLDDLEQAELHFRAAIQLDRADTESMFELASLHHRNGHVLQATRQLNVLLQEDPLHEDARELLAVLHLQEGALDAAMEQFKELEKSARTPTTKARCRAVLEHFQTRDAKVYRRTLLEAMEQSRPDARTWIAVAESYDRFDEAAEIKSAYMNALALDPDNEVAALGLIEAQRRLLDFESAAEELKSLLPRRPNRHSWRHELIDLYLIMQDYDAALTLAREQEARSELDDTARTRYRVAIIEALRLTDEDEEVLRQLKSWADDQPDEPAWLIRLAEEYRRQDQPARAIPLYETAYATNKKLLYEFVDALVEADQYDRASQLVLERLYDDPDSDDAVARLAYILAVGSRGDDAIELLRNKLLHSINREDLQTLVVRHLRNLNRHDEAVDLVEALIDEVMFAMQTIREDGARGGRDGLPDDEIARRPEEPFSLAGLHHRLVVLRLELARSLLAAEDLRKAEHMLDSWATETREPSERAEYLNLLAVCYQRRGDESRSNETLQRVLAIVPDDPGLNNNVAYTWIDRNMRLKEAERMTRFAVWRAPRQAAYLDTYGWLQYKKGLFEEALKWLERARRAMANPDPVVLDHLGDTCWRMGRHEEAVDYWTGAVDAVGERDEGPLPSDARRVRDGTPGKIAAARKGDAPAVETVAEPEAESAALNEQSGS